jgi:hypothetical protein
VAAVTVVEPLAEDEAERAGGLHLGVLVDLSMYDD